MSLDIYRTSGIPKYRTAELPLMANSWSYTGGTAVYAVTPIERVTTQYRKFRTLAAPRKEEAPVVVVTTDTPKSEAVRREKSLRRLEALFAEWDAMDEAGDSIDDDWLRDLRAGWGKRLDDLYGFNDW